MSLTTVLISTINDPNLNRTIEEIRKTADGKVEFIVINDGGSPLKLSGIKVINQSKMFGRRISFNRAAHLATGTHLLIIDPHCSMSEHWDTKMIESCGDKNLVFSVLRDMDENFIQRHGPYLHVSMNREYTEKWWPKKPLKDCAVEEESMCFTGCGWMIKKDRFWELGGYDETLGKYGWDGPEWSCKIWMSDDPGKVILRTDVVCGHIFGTNLKHKLYKCEMIPKPKYLEYMKNKWGTKIDSLVEYFSPVPNWYEDGVERSIMSQGTEREVKLQRQKERVERDTAGEIIKKVIEHWEYVYEDDGKGPTEQEILKEHTNDLKKVSEEVWELKDGQLQKVA